MGPRKVRDFTAKKKEKKTENDKEKTIRVNNQIHIYIYISTRRNKLARTRIQKLFSLCSTLISKE